MKKTFAAFFILFVIVTSCAEEESIAKYKVNGQLLTEMPYHEIYNCEDELIYTLELLFSIAAEAEEDADLARWCVINTTSNKSHYPWCIYALQIAPGNRSISVLDSKKPYVSCKYCSRKSPRTFAELIRSGDSYPKYKINDSILAAMSIYDIYDFEDALISALTVKFNKDCEEGANGELIGYYVVNNSTKRFHYPWCYSVIQANPENRILVKSAPSDLDDIYKPCGNCSPHINTK